MGPGFARSGGWIRSTGPPCSSPQPVAPEGRLPSPGRRWAVFAGPCDGLVSDRYPSVAVAVLTADCAPLALASPEGVFAAVHAGWRGLAGGVVEAAVAAMRDLGCHRGRGRARPLHPPPAATSSRRPTSPTWPPPTARVSGRKDHRRPTRARPVAAVRRRRWSPAEPAGDGGDRRLHRLHGRPLLPSGPPGHRAPGHGRLVRRGPVRRASDGGSGPTTAEFAWRLAEVRIRIASADPGRDVRLWWPSPRGSTPTQ